METDSDNMRGWDLCWLQVTHISIHFSLCLRTSAANVVAIFAAVVTPGATCSTRCSTMSSCPPLSSLPPAPEIRRSRHRVFAGRSDLLAASWEGSTADRHSAWTFSTSNTTLGWSCRCYHDHANYNCQSVGFSVNVSRGFIWRRVNHKASLLRWVSGARGPFFNGDQVKNQLLSCNMLRLFSPHPLKWWPLLLLWHLFVTSAICNFWPPLQILGGQLTPCPSLTETLLSVFNNLQIIPFSSSFLKLSELMCLIKKSIPQRVPRSQLTGKVWLPKLHISVCAFAWVTRSQFSFSLSVFYQSSIHPVAWNFASSGVSCRGWLWIVTSCTSW